MATRSNIKVGQFWLYRHWDGYPAANGAALARTMKQLGTYGKKPLYFVNRLLTLQYEKTKYDPRPKLIYELTDSQHGDIEWLYEISFGKDGPTYLVQERKPGSDTWKKYPPMGERGFRTFVAQDLLAMRKRMKAIKAKNAA